MLGTERTVHIGEERVSVIDYGGSGVDVLLVHSPGYCAPAWDFVAKALGGRVHAYAVDLPGHGHSGGDLVGAAETRGLIAEVAAALELDRPVLVGVDFAGYYVLAIAAERPSLPRAVVSVGGFALRDRAASQDVLDFAGSQEMASDMRSRFHFGVQGSEQSKRDELVDDLVARGGRDWLLVDLEQSGLRIEVQWSLRELPDGSWLHLPRPSSVQAGYRVSPDDPFFPEPGLFDKVEAPTWLVISLGGQDDDLVDSGRRVSQAHDNVTFVKIDGGFSPHYKAFDVLADLVLEAAETP